MIEIAKRLFWILDEENSVFSSPYSILFLQNALDIPANDEADDFDTNKMGQAIKDKLDAIKKTYDEQFTALKEVGGWVFR